jgi:hypothetical protein
MWKGATMKEALMKADKIILAGTVGNVVFGSQKIMVMTGKDGESWDPSLINNPVNAGYALAATDTDVALLDYICKGQLRLIVTRITSNPPEQPSNPTTYTVLEPSNMDIEDWSKVIAENVTIQDGSGNRLATNPHGLAQAKKRSHLIDYDSQIITVLGEDDFDTIPSGQDFLVPSIPPYDMGLNTEVGLPPEAKGKTIIAMKDEDGVIYIFAMYIIYDGTTGEHSNTIIVKLKVVDVDEEGPNFSGLEYAGQVSMDALNGQEMSPGYDSTVDGDVSIYVPFLGGSQQTGATNGVNSMIKSVPAFTNWLANTPIPVTRITGVDQIPGQEIAYFDFHATAVSGLENGDAVFYIMTVSYLSGWKGFDYRIYKTTVSKVASYTTGSNTTLADLENEIVDEGRIYTTTIPGLPFGIYYHNMLLLGANTAAGEKLFVFLGTELMVCGATEYKARALLFGEGEGPGRIGGENANSFILPGETIRQYEEDKSLKRGVTAMRIQVSGEEEE